MSEEKTFDQNEDILKSLGELASIFEGMDIDKINFGNASFFEMFGRVDSDPISEKQRRFVFYLGKKMGMAKDEIKQAYQIDSLAKLTFGEAKIVLAKMIRDADYFSEDASAATEREKTLVWSVENGLDFVGSGFAKCGHCKDFSGQNTTTTGKCEKGIIPGTYKGSDRAPMNKKCFCFKYSEKPIVKESTAVPSGIDYDSF